jgi:hypothetical protein
MDSRIKLALAVVMRAHPKRNNHLQNKEFKQKNKQTNKKNILSQGSLRTGNKSHCTCDGTLH